MAKLYNLARMTTATVGTGTVTLGAAVSGYLTFAQAGISNGDVVDYAIKDGNNSEIGTGTYTASGTTLTRTVSKSTNSNAAINLSGTAEVLITPRAETLADASSLTGGTLDPARIASRALGQGKLNLSGLSNPGPADLNTNLTAGFYANTGYLNSPSGAGATSTYWYIIVQEWDASGYTQQIAAPLNSGLNELYIRMEFNGTWSAWTRLYARNNILGTVSQSGGVPTGAIIESGSNANGWYTRYADGTQVCWGQNAATTNYSGGTTTFPVAFVDTNTKLKVTPYATGSVASSATNTLTTTSFQAAMSQAGQFMWSAIGRWF